MGFETLQEILNFAIEKEKEAVVFYQDLAQQAPFAGARETLEGFSIEERKHQVMLENIDKDRGKIEEYEFEKIPDLKRSDYLVDAEYEKSMVYPDLLRLAMKREEIALKLYNELIKKAEKEEFKKVFQMLSQEEAKHKLKLETLYDDYMAEQGD
jgi:rubrerythrin